MKEEVLNAELRNIKEVIWTIKKSAGNKILQKTWILRYFKVKLEIKGKTNKKGQAEYNAKYIVINFVVNKNHSELKKCFEGNGQMKKLDRISSKIQRKIQRNR